MRVRQARVKSMSHRLAFHNLGSFSKLNLLSVENKGMSEDLGNTFQLVMGGNNKVATFREL